MMICYIKANTTLRRLGKTMRGMGSYTPLELELSHLSSDELNEMYLNGELDKMYEEFDRTKEVEPLRIGRKRKFKGGKSA